MAVNSFMELNCRVYEFTWDSLRARAQGFYMGKTPSFVFTGCSFGCSEYSMKPMKPRTQ